MIGVKNHALYFCKIQHQEVEVNYEMATKECEENKFYVKVHEEHIPLNPWAIIIIDHRNVYVMFMNVFSGAWWSAEQSKSRKGQNSEVSQNIES